MAKKKVSKSHQEKPSLNQEDEDLVVVSPSMDSDASGKLKNLKSLNQMLLKEAFERCQQVESLMQANKSLESELTCSDSEREVLWSELSEKAEIKKSWDEDKQLTHILEGKILEMENRIGENFKATKEKEAKNVAIYAEKIDLENQCRTLQEEITSLENSLKAARSELGSMKSQVELASANSELALNLLKETADFCSMGGGKDAGNGDFLGGKLRNDKGTYAYAMKLEMIKNAFKSNEAKIENLNRQLKFLQNSVAVAKKKSFWTLLSSATTLPVAVSLAYVARRC